MYHYIIRRCSVVALRKESVDRNFRGMNTISYTTVALRKESVDRNVAFPCPGWSISFEVALRKESVDRNCAMQIVIIIVDASLSARRAWIEICGGAFARRSALLSLSARRAWIEIGVDFAEDWLDAVALRKESVDRNYSIKISTAEPKRRSPQGERG